MFSLRTLARAAPRIAVPRIASTMPSRILLRTSGAMAATARLPTSSSSFSTSASAQKKRDVEEYDEATYELANKLDAEIQFENEIADQDNEPASVKDWLENSDFELIDTPGRQDVKLVRDFQDEKITVTFSIGGLDPMDDMYNDNMDEDAMPEDEDALSDPDHSDNLSPSQRNKRNKGTLSRPALEEEEDSGIADDEDGLIDEEAMTPPLSINIVIEKPGKAGSLSIDAAAQHGTLVVDNMAYYDNATTAKGQSQDSMWAQQGVYAGPPFHSLDEDLQLIVERYLEERGIGQALALFAIDYIDTKEQREYVRWLKNVKSFVERKP